MTIDTTTLTSLKRTIKPDMRFALVRHDWIVSPGAPGFQVGMVRPVEAVCATHIVFGHSDTGLCQLSHMRWPSAADYRRTGPNGFEVRLTGDGWMGYELCTG